MRVDVRPGTVAVFSDVVCGWSTVALHRFYQARSAAGLDEQVHIDHQLFPLEEINKAAVPKAVLDTEIPVAGALAPDFGWKPWQADTAAWPVTSLPANEAVQAAKQQSWVAAEELDMALRRAFFCDSRTISLLHEISDIAGRCAHVDTQRLQRDLESGSARAQMMATYRRCADTVQGSPHFFLVDGEDAVNPGVRFHWNGRPGAGFPVIDENDGVAFDVLVRRAAQPSPVHRS